MSNKKENYRYREIYRFAKRLDTIGILLSLIGLFSPSWLMMIGVGAGMVLASLAIKVTFLPFDFDGYDE